MRINYFFLILFLTGCAQGYDGWGWDSPEGSGGSPPEPIPAFTTVPTQPQATLPPLPVEPYQETDDQALIYTLDESFWTPYISYIHAPTQTIYKVLDCPNGGTVIFSGGVQSDPILGHQNLKFSMEFGNCLAPTPWVAANFLLTGTMMIRGYTEQGPFENMVWFFGNLEIQGEIHYQDGHISHICEICGFKFFDNFHESLDFGGLNGKICKREVSMTEHDLFP